MDAVKAVIELIDNNSTIGDYFNVGGVGEVSIRELAEKIIELTQSQSTITYLPYADAYAAGFEDMQRRVPDISKIKNAIGWQPSYALDAIIESVAASLQ